MTPAEGETLAGTELAECLAERDHLEGAQAWAIFCFALIIAFNIVLQFARVFGRSK